MKRLIALIFAAQCGICTILADVTGVVRGSDSQPIQGASVVLLALPDSTYVDGALTDAQGRFSIPGEQASQPYLLSAQAFGHERKYVQLTGTPAEPLDITLALAATELGEVTVRGKAPSTTREGGKFIFIPNDLADDVSSANNLMKHVPLVSWNDDGAYITGKGLSKVYLNGRDPHWDTNEIQAMLSTLDPHCIKRVEVITDPGATQAASYTGGVINIIYDDPSQGWRGNLSTSASVNSDSPNVSPNVWLSYQKARFRASANLNYNYNRLVTKETKSYDFNPEGRTVTNDVDDSSYSHTVVGRVSLNYDLTERSVLGAGISIQDSYSHSDNLVKTKNTVQGVDSYGEMRQTRRSPMKAPSISGILYYTLYTDSKYSTLDVLAGYSSYSKEHNFINDFSGTRSMQDLSHDIETYAVMASYTHVFNPKSVLKFGADWLDSHRRQAQTLDGDFRRFKHNERQIHGYIQYGRVWSDAFTSEIGLRVENTRVDGRQSQEQTRNRQDYTDLFPSVNLSLNLPFGGQSIALSYARHIVRPDMNQLNPYKIWASENSYTQGNPDLKPAYSDYVSMYYSFLQDFIFNVSYSYDYRLMMPYTINSPEGLSVSSFTNTGRTNSVYLGLSYNKGLLPWWRTSASASAGYNNIKTEALSQGIHVSGWNYALAWHNSFIISRRHQLSASLSQDLSSPSDKGTYKEDWKYRIDASVQKAFACGLEVSLSGMIPVTGFKDYEKFTVPEYSYEYRRNLTPYYVGMSISYSFGKQQVRGARDRIDEVK